jgi:hypothetical protein
MAMSMGSSHDSGAAPSSRLTNKSMTIDVEHPTEPVGRIALAERTAGRRDDGGGTQAFTGPDPDDGNPLAPVTWPTRAPSV